MTSKHDDFEMICEAAQWIEERTSGFHPDTALILGSGLGRFGARIQVQYTFSYDEIPHFKASRVEGHAGQLLLGVCAGEWVICQQGRYHFYEGHTPQEVVFPVRVMHRLGARRLLVTNAAGGIQASFCPGDIMLITDHINATGRNPLMGDHDARLGPRFPDMTCAYDLAMRETIIRLAGELDIPLQQGVYIWVTGPSYETPAEIRAYRAMGADAVGMSTVPEVIAARHLGMSVVGLSCITNAAAGMGEAALDHGDVQDVTAKMSQTFESLVEAWLKNLSKR